MAYKYDEAEIIKVIEESDTIKRFIIKVPAEIPFTFKAGQFIMLNLPIDSKYTNRSYSIASPPNNDNTFELCIVINPNGLGTNFMWSNYKEGTKVNISKVLGKFQLPEVIDRDICFIGTGTGIAPLRSMAVDILKQGRPCKNIYMVFGNRWEKDISYRSEFESLEKEFSNFKFIPVLSRDNEQWTGRKGYVHAIYEEIFSDNRPAYFYICGWSDMLKEARHRLENMGYDKNAIRFESYD